MASWFGWGGGSSDAGASSSTTSSNISPELALHGDDEPVMSGGFGGPAAAGHHQESPVSYSQSPVLALDQLKQVGVPLNRQMTPYLQIDPSMFASSQPQYIAPDGGVSGKGRFEFALGHVGWAVGMGYGLGTIRGAIPEMMNTETRQLTAKPWLTRMANATVKHGAGYAQPAGVAVFMYSVLEIGMRQIRADDDFNSLFAGALTGAIYRSPHGARAMAFGSAVGGALATTWVFVNQDSRERMFNMLAIR